MFPKTQYVLKILWRGLTLRCPNCGKGRIYPGLFNLFKMEETCPYCHVRYERKFGESLGGMFINLPLVEVLSLGGYFLTQWLFAPPLAFQLTFWVTFNLAFVILFYRHSRSLWIAISYLTSGVYVEYVDPDYEAPNT